ncbi:hypothetical protein C8J57DRAFT_1232299 [Mycena rebaudengoi]|nr:hypothetical protein C8J57DRAFT_1232299 [Mycena rebaudengoi]
MYIVHMAIYDGLLWVAKCSCNIGAGEGQVDIQENLDQVVKEVTRLCKLGYFVTRFIGEARKQDVEIEQGIRVTDFKLGVEIVDNAVGPSNKFGNWNVRDQMSGIKRSADIDGGTICGTFKLRSRQTMSAFLASCQQLNAIDPASFHRS